MEEKSCFENFSSEQKAEVQQTQTHFTYYNLTHTVWYLKPIPKPRNPRKEPERRERKSQNIKKQQGNIKAILSDYFSLIYAFNHAAGSFGDYVKVTRSRK